MAKRRRLPKSDAWVTPGYASKLRGGEVSDQTFINAVLDGRLEALKILSSDTMTQYALRWGDVRRFAARPYRRPARAAKPGTETTAKNIEAGTERHGTPNGGRLVRRKSLRKP